MTDDEIEALIRKLIEVDLDAETRTAVLAWFETACCTISAMVDLGLVEKVD